MEEIVLKVSPFPKDDIVMMEPFSLEQVRRLITEWAEQACVEVKEEVIRDIYEETSG
jgi:hypothetical protein